MQEEHSIDLDNITDDQLEAMYVYLAFNMNTMSKEEKIFWIETMKKIDKDFYEID